MQVIGSSHSLRANWPLIALVALLAGCQPADPGNGNETAEKPVLNLPAAVTPVTSMDRQMLLLAVAKAASARTTGMDDERDQRLLEGRPFEFPIRFGCEGDAADLRSAVLGWSFQPDQNTLRLRATPTISADDPVAAIIGGESTEAIEGFWVPLPWALQAACPAIEWRPTVPAEPVRNGIQASEEAPDPSLRWPKVGIAQFFSSSDTRTRRRNRRAYEAVVTVEQGSSVGSQGFNLVLSGRLRARPNKRVIECVASTGYTPPDCIISADIHEVRMERPESGDVLARWNS